MSKNVTGVIKTSRVVIPQDLLKKFQAEAKSGIELRHFPTNGIMIFPEEILSKWGYGGLAKAGFEVVIIPREE
jgi:hypothetical protein